MPSWKHGDLVWVHVRGHPVWPGQVMDAKKAPDTAKSRQKAGTTLVAFFGDSSFGWFGPDLILPFKKHLEAYAGQKDASHKSFTRAVEEAVEVMIRREGGVPTTNHVPLDFLTSADLDGLPEGDPRAAMVVKVPSPAKPSGDDVKDSDPAAALEWLLASAEDPAAVIDAASGTLVLSFLLTRTNESKAKGKKKRPPKVKKEKKASEPAPEIEPEPPEVVEVEVQEMEDIKDEDFVLTGALAVLTEGAARRAANPVRKVRRRSKVTRAADKPDQPHPLEVEDKKEPAVGEENKAAETELGEDGQPKKKTPARKGPARRRKGLFLKDDRGFIHLKMTLEEGINALGRLAVDPWDWLPEEETDAPHPLRVMLLRYREQAYERSHLHLTTASDKDDVALGDLLTEALKTAEPACVSKAEVDEKEAKAREKAREKAAEKAAERAAKPKGPGRRRPLGLDPIVPDSEMTGPVKIFRTLIEHVPPTPEAFRDDIQKLYDRLGGTLPQTVNYEKGTIDLHGLLKGVAAFGGYQWVCYKKHWKAIALELRPDLRDHTHTHTGHNLKERYYKFLLRYEEELNKDLPYEQKERKKRRRRNTGAGRGRGRKMDEEGGMKMESEDDDDDDDDMTGMGGMSSGKMKKRAKMDMNGGMGVHPYGAVSFQQGIPKYAGGQTVQLMTQLDGILNPSIGMLPPGMRPMATMAKTPEEMARMQQKRAEDAERQRNRDAEPKTGLTAVKLTFDDGVVMPASLQVRTNVSRYGEVSVETEGNFCMYLVYQYEFDARMAFEALTAPSKHGGMQARHILQTSKDPILELVAAPAPAPNSNRPWLPRLQTAANLPGRLPQQGPVAVPAPVLNHMGQATMIDPRRGTQGVSQLGTAYLNQAQAPMALNSVDPRGQRAAQGTAQGLQQHAALGGMQQLQGYMLHPQNYSVSYGLQGALGMHVPQMQVATMQVHQPQQHLHVQTSTGVVATNDALNIPLNLDANDLAALMHSITSLPQQQQDVGQVAMAQVNSAAAPVAPADGTGEQGDYHQKMMLGLLGRLGDSGAGDGQA